jgi:NitT/TauT family transport system permease protein
MNKRHFYSFIGPIIFFVAWESIGRSGLVASYILPPFSEVLVSFIELMLSGELITHVSISIVRIFFGFGMAALVAIPLGLFMGWTKNVERSINPVIEMLRPLSPIALFPLFILWFGIGIYSKIAIIFWVCWFPILINTIKGVKTVDPLLIKAAKSMGAKNSVLFTKVVMPSSIFWIITGLRISIAASLLALIAAEMIGANSGIGFFVLISAQTFKTLNMYAGIITIGMIGFVFNYFFLLLEKKLTKWHK